MIQNNNTNNSTTITNSTVNATQFAAGSSDFQGVINNITTNDVNKLDELTEKLLSELKVSKLEGVNNDEVIDAIKQVQVQAKEQKVNKISIKGLLTGIQMVMDTAKGVSANLLAIYSAWHGHLASLFH